MTEPAYVKIANDYAQKIRGGELPAGIQIPSYPEIASRYGVSQIVVRQAVELLLTLGLVRSVRRRGIFVADRPNLRRVSPERQLEDTEVTFAKESDLEVQIDREVNRVPATDELADILGIAPGAEIQHVITKATEDRRPVSISDTYQAVEVDGIADATVLEETIADRLPTHAHAEWLRTTPGDLVKTVHQRFITADNQVVMVSDVSYPRDRYDAFVFRMSLTPEDATA